ncbi:MAG: peptide deformylase [Acidobacteria bacterium]|nr:MAG: peptide deformylase [Acidobacteriota bacterium]
MSLLKIARMGHPVLRKTARPVSASELSSVPIQKLIDDMLETMRESRGIGLAAPQVHESLRLFVAALLGPAEEEGGDEREMEAVAFVNPEIQPVGRDVADDWEGCLSIPDIRALVPRPRRIRIKALDREGRRIEFDLRDYAGRVMQHEYDHLDGILFLDRVKRYDSLTYLEELEKYHRD